MRALTQRFDNVRGQLDEFGRGPTVTCLGSTVPFRAIQNYFICHIICLIWTKILLEEIILFKKICHLTKARPKSIYEELFQCNKKNIYEIALPSFRFDF